MTDEDFKQITGIPEPYGTKKCYDCQKEPEDTDNWWHRFVEISGQEYSVPMCDECHEEFNRNTTGDKAPWQPA